MVQPSTGPAGPGGDAAASYQQATPLLPLQIIPPLGHQLGQPHPSASSSQARPQVAQKAPRSKAGKAQLVAASQKRGCGGGSKGIHLEDSSASSGAKQRKQSNQPDSSNNCRPQYEDTFEDSDDSKNPLTGLSQVLLCLLWPAALLATLPSHPSDGRRVFHSASPRLCIWADTSSICFAC